MRVLRSHHISKLVLAIDAIYPRSLPNPKGGRPGILHRKEYIALLLFSCFVAPYDKQSLCYGCVYDPNMTYLAVGCKR